MIKHIVDNNAFKPNVYFRDVEPFTGISADHRKKIRPLLDYFKTTAKHHLNIPNGKITACYTNTGNRSISIQNAKIKLAVLIKNYETHLLIINPQTNKPSLLMKNKKWCQEIKPIVSDLFELNFTKENWAEIKKTLTDQHGAKFDLIG